MFLVRHGCSSGSGARPGAGRSARRQDHAGDVAFEGDRAAVVLGRVDRRPASPRQRPGSRLRHTVEPTSARTGGLGPDRHIAQDSSWRSRLRCRCRPIWSTAPPPRRSRSRRSCASASRRRSRLRGAERDRRSAPRRPRARSCRRPRRSRARRPARRRPGRPDELCVEALHQARHVVARIAIRHVAADRAHVAHLRIGDLQRRLAQDRCGWPARHWSISSACVVMAPMVMLRAVDPSMPDRPGTSCRSIRCGDVGHAQLHHRDQAVPAGHHTRVVAVLRPAGPERPSISFGR